MKTLAIHPGEILRTEFMDSMGLTSYRSRRNLGCPFRVCMTLRGLSARFLPIRLCAWESYFGTSAQFWLNLQNRFDLAEAAKDKTIAKIKQRASEAA